MIERDYQYIQGSTVRQIIHDSAVRQPEYDDLEYDASEQVAVEYDVYEENKLLKAKRQYKSNRKVKLKMVMAIIAVLAAGLTVMWRYAIITQMSYEISQREADYNKLRNDNAMLRVKIETATDLTEVKEVAENKLGMRMPDKSQIVYVKIPRNDYTVLMETQDEASDEGSIFKAVLNKVQGLAGFFK